MPGGPSGKVPGVSGRELIGRISTRSGKARFEGCLAKRRGNSSGEDSEDTVRKPNC